MGHDVEQRVTRDPSEKVTDDPSTHLLPALSSCVRSFFIALWNVVYAGLCCSNKTQQLPMIFS